MESRVEQAVELHRQGYNCAQSVLVTYADLFGLDREQALRLSSSFGGGMAGMRQVCGTVSAMAMIAGMATGPVSPADKEARKVNNDTVKLLADEFAAENGSIVCGQLLGLQPGIADGKSKKPCSEYVRTSAALIEKHLLKDRE